MRLWGAKCGRAFGLIYIQRLITVLIAACPDLKLVPWICGKKTAGQVHLFSACGSCLPTALKAVVCLLLYCFSPSLLSSSLALHVTLSQVSRHITTAAVKPVFCLFCVVTGSGFKCPYHCGYHGKAAAKPLLWLYFIIEKGPCALPNLRLPFLAQFLHLWI